MKQTLFSRSLLLVLLILVMHLLAYKFYWYASIWWYDMLMHTLGGVFIAILAGALFTNRLKGKYTRSVFLAVILWVVAVGVAWEIFEYIVQGFIKGVPIADPLDSLSDLLCDTIGGLVGSFFVIRAMKRYNTSYEPVQKA